MVVGLVEGEEVGVEVVGDSGEVGVCCGESCVEGCGGVWFVVSVEGVCETKAGSTLHLPVAGSVPRKQKQELSFMHMPAPFM